MSGLSVVLRWGLAMFVGGAAAAQAADEPAGNAELTRRPTNPVLPAVCFAGRPAINFSSGIRYTATARQGAMGGRLTMTVPFPE